MSNDNTVKTENGIEIYENNIAYFADEYIATLSDPDEEMKKVSKFTGMLIYISEHIEKIPYENIELLDHVFNIYIKLCCKYDKLPTLEMFSLLVDISSTTFTNWSNGEYRLGSSHLAAVKKWKNTCKTFLINDLQNTNGTNANKIFIAKAAYGMAETAPTTIEQRQQVESLEDIQKKYAELSEKGTQLPPPKAEF